MKVALISCVKTKTKMANKASELYTSQLFKMNYNYAKKTCGRVFILSAKHGLLEENQVIGWYEQTLSKMNIADRKKWAARVIQQLSEKADLQNDIFIVLAGIKYREMLLPHIKNYEIPLEGLSFGRQLQKLKGLSQ